MPNSRTKKTAPVPIRKAHQSNLLFIVAGVTICVAVALFIASRDFMIDTARPPNVPAPATAASTQSAGDAPSAPESAPVADNSPPVDDDGKTLWQSPTSGKPLALAFL